MERLALALAVHPVVALRTRSGRTLLVRCTFRRIVVEARTALIAVLVLVVVSRVRTLFSSLGIEPRARRNALCTRLIAPGTGETLTRTTALTTAVVAIRGTLVTAFATGRGTSLTMRIVGIETGATLAFTVMVMVFVVHIFLVLIIHN